jgi:release factor glutamine methyltransferase
MTKETIREVILRASRFLEDKGIRHPRLNAEVLLQHVLGWEKYQLLAEMHMEFPEESRETYERLIMRRGSHEPLQYIVGHQEFFGRDFIVRKGVLIPRPETEILVEEVCKRKEMFTGHPVIVDVGTGSGAIAVTLALEWPEAQVSAIDLSKDALEVAQENAVRLGASVSFYQGDLLEPILREGLWIDVLVSNPPYIPSGDVHHLDKEVRCYEPLLALDGGEDGLFPYRLMVQQLPLVMREEGPALVAFEVGIHQAEAVARLIEQAWPPARTTIVPDWQGIGRVVIGWRESIKMFC